MDDRFISQSPNGYQLEFLAHRELVAQTADIGFDGIVLCFGIVTPNLIHQLLFGEYDIGIGEKLVQQFKFLVC
ncbi:hypothetical protein D1872_341740 [compost metagenome]